MKSKNINIEKQYSYSKVGKFSLQKYSYLTDKNQKINEKLLKKKNRKNLFNDFFKEPVIIPKTEDMESFFSNDDIFNKEYKINLLSNNLNNKEFEVKSSCSYLNKNKNTENKLYKIRANIINNNFNRSFDKYKYHLLHHNESPNYFMEKKISPSCTRYNPKLEYIYKKLIYSISFKKMSGRQNKFKNKDIKELSYHKIKEDNDISKIYGSKEFKSSFSKSPLNSIDKYIHGSVNMKFQLSRQSLPNHNDFRIRNNIFNNNKNLSLYDKEQEDIFNKKMYKTQFYLKNENSVKNNFIFTNYKMFPKITNRSQSLLKTMKKKFSKILLKKLKIKDKNNIDQSQKNKINNIVLKNEKIKSEIEKNLLNYVSESKVNDDDNNIYINNNGIKSKKKIEKQNNKYSQIFPESSFFIKGKNLKNELLNKNNSNKKSKLCESKSCLNINTFKSKNVLDKHHKGINFEKMLSREYLNKINRYEESMHPMITPSCSAVVPKSIMKVIYSKCRHNHSPKKFHGFNGEFTFDINKIFYKYNNHFSPRIFHFNKMEGRSKNKNSNLPSFMLGLFYRNSLDNFNENSLKMNNYFNGNFQEIKSTFNAKKSFNIRLILDELKKKDNINIMEYKNKKNIMKQPKNTNIKKKNNLDNSYNNKNGLLNIIGKNKSWKKLLGEFYRIDFDKLEKYNSFIGTKLDGVTLKSYNKKDKYLNLLSKKEKKIFQFDINNN